MSTSVDPTHRSVNGLSTGTVTRKEVVDALAQYFGPIGQAGDVGADRLLPREILTLPEAYKGAFPFPVMQRRWAHPILSRFEKQAAANF